MPPSIKMSGIAVALEPVAPVDPVAPVLPVDPVAPVAPAVPVLPVAPVAPVNPVDPVVPAIMLSLFYLRLVNMPKRLYYPAANFLGHVFVHVP